MIFDPKRPLGVRVTSNTANELKRIAAAQNCSVNELTERILVSHIRAIIQGEEIDWERFRQELDERISKFETRHSQAIKEWEQRCNRSIDGLKAMVDSHVKACHPDRYDEYVRQVMELQKYLGKPLN